MPDGAVKTPGEPVIDDALEILKYLAGLDSNVTEGTMDDVLFILKVLAGLEELPALLSAPVEDEPTEEDPIEDEPIEEDPIEDEPIEEDPIEDEPIEEDPIEDEPIEEDPIEDEPVEEDPVEDEPIEEDPIEDKIIVYEPKEFGNATIDQNFSGTSVLLTMDVAVGGQNVKHELSFFGDFPMVEIVDLTEYSFERVNFDFLRQDGYVGTDNEIFEQRLAELKTDSFFRQILQIKLPIDCKQNVLDVIAILEKVDGIRSVGPSYYGSGGI